MSSWFSSRPTYHPNIRSDACSPKNRIRPLQEHLNSFQFPGLNLKPWNLDMVHWYHWYLYIYLYILVHYITLIAPHQSFFKSCCESGHTASALLVSEVRSRLGQNSVRWTAEVRHGVFCRAVLVRVGIWGLMGTLLCLNICIYIDICFLSYSLQMHNHSISPKLRFIQCDSLA